MPVEDQHAVRAERDHKQIDAQLAAQLRTASAHVLASERCARLGLIDLQQVDGVKAAQIALRIDGDWPTTCSRGRDARLVDDAAAVIREQHRVKLRRQAGHTLGTGAAGLGRHGGAIVQPHHLLATVQTTRKALRKDARLGRRLGARPAQQAAIVDPALAQLLLEPRARWVAADHADHAGL